MTARTGVAALGVGVGLMLAAVPLRVAARAPIDAVVLLSIDTLRADRLGTYGCRVDTSPTIDALARDAVVFERAVPTCPATGPSVASMLTGRHRAGHGVFRNGNQLRRGVATLAHVLRSRRFATAAVVANPVVSQPGFERGFQRFVMAEPDPARPALGADVPAVKAAGRMLRDFGRRRFFLWLHLMAPHGPYQPPDAYRRRFPPRRYIRRRQPRRLPLLDGNYGLGGIPRYQQLGPVAGPELFRARYDAEIRYTDDLVRAVIGRLQRLGRWERTLLIVTADHGESLGERDVYFQHGFYAYDNTVRVPLLIRAPGRWAPRRVDASVSLVDLMPTVLDLLNVRTSAVFEGTSLVPLVEQGGRSRPAFTQTYYGNRLTALTFGRWKYIRTPDPKSLLRTSDGWMRQWPREAREELYDLESDPREVRDLSTARPDVLEGLADRTREWLRTHPEGRPAGRHAAPEPTGVESEPTGVDPELHEQLRALGYAD